MEPETQLLNPPGTTKEPKGDNILNSQKSTPWLETPLIHSRSLSELANCQIYLKLDNLQPSGSFKSRAMGNQILSNLSKLSKEKNGEGQKLHFFASSGGNAGLAAVCAARSLGYPCTVVVPLSTSDLMVEKLIGEGAEVVRFGENIKEAGIYMEDVVMGGLHCGKGKDEKNNEVDEEDEKITKIALHPFDGESIWEGNSTIIDELVRQLPPLVTTEDENPDHDVDACYEGSPLPVDAIVCSVGGGGLLNGLIMGLERLKRDKLQSPIPPEGKDNNNDNDKKMTRNRSKKRKDIHLIAVETEGTHSLSLSISQHSLSSLPRISSKATSLGVIRVSERTFEYALHPPEGTRVHSVVLSDAEAARGVLQLADRERMLVELACGVCVDVAVGPIKLTSSSSSLDGAESTAKTAVTESRARKRKRVTNEKGDGYGDDDVDTDVDGCACRCNTNEKLHSPPPSSRIRTEIETDPNMTSTLGSGSGSESDSNGFSSSLPSTAKTTPSVHADAGVEHGLLTSESEPVSTLQFKSRLHQLVPDLTPQSRVVIIVCGGSNVTIDMAAEWRTMLKEGWK